MQLNLAQHAARRADLQAELGRLQQQRAVHLSAGNLEAVTHLDRQLKVIDDDLALHAEYIVCAAQKAAHPVRAERRSEAREIAAEADAVVEALPQLAATADAAADAFIAAIGALLAAQRKAASLARKAAKLACDDMPLHQRPAFDALTPGSGVFCLASVMVLRDAFAGLDSPKHVFEPAPGLQFGPEPRLPFVDAIKWVTDRVDVSSAIGRECVAEEALAAELKAGAGL